MTSILRMSKYPDLPLVQLLESCGIGYAARIDWCDRNVSAQAGCPEGSQAAELITVDYNHHQSSTDYDFSSTNRNSTVAWAMSHARALTAFQESA